MSATDFLFACPTCKDFIRLSDYYPVGVAVVGHKVMCPKCRERILVPSPLASLPATSPPAPNAPTDSPLSASPPAFPPRPPVTHHSGMTESEWLSSTDPMAMLDALRDRASERKLRFFACGYCRQIWHQLTEERNRRAVEVAEQFADEEVTQKELKAAFSAADDAWETATDDAWEAVVEASEGGWDASVVWG